MVKVMNTMTLLFQEAVAFAAITIIRMHNGMISGQSVSPSGAGDFSIFGMLPELLEAVSHSLD